jgi:hypothetical protein
MHPAIRVCFIQSVYAKASAGHFRCAKVGDGARRKRRARSLSALLREPCASHAPRLDRLARMAANGGSNGPPGQIAVSWRLSPCTRAGVARCRTPMSHRPQRFNPVGNARFVRFRPTDQDERRTIWPSRFAQSPILSQQLGVSASPLRRAPRRSRSTSSEVSELFELSHDADGGIVRRFCGCGISLNLSPLYTGWSARLRRALRL